VSSLQIIIAFCFFAYAWLKAPHVLRVDREVVKLFGGFVTVVNFLKAVALFAVVRHVWPEKFQEITRIFDMIPANHLLAVWWEDSFYVLPYLLVTPAILSIRSAWLRMAAMGGAFLVFLVTTLHFMLGHLYQGPAGLVTAVYPFISYAMGGRKGLGTVMVLHILFDFTIYMSIWMLLALSGG
jgi:hypothetical protein